MVVNTMSLQHSMQPEPVIARLVARHHLDWSAQLPRHPRANPLDQLKKCIRITASHRAAIKSADFPRAISCDQFIHSADDSHGQRFSASAHVYFAHRKSTHFDAGSGSDDVGHNELTTIIFGQVLETSSHMYRIADCCQEKAIPVAKLAQDHVAGVEADADCNWLRQFVSQCSIHVGETAVNKLRRNQCLRASLMRASMYAKDRHHAVADELVGHAACVDYRACHGIEEMIQ